VKRAKGTLETGVDAGLVEASIVSPAGVAHPLITAIGATAAAMPNIWRRHAPRLVEGRCAVKRLSISIALQASKADCIAYVRSV
jgi:hypothetical protein